MRSLLAALISCFLSTAALAQTTAFTYQGELKSGGTPANGPHDLRFRLFSVASGGTQIGTQQCVDNVPVADGKFSATIDFGQQFASSAARFLEVIVRADVGQPCTDDFGYVTLSPRQAITPAPRAAAANTAFSLTAPDGDPANAVVVSNAGGIGIGTASPTHSVHIANTAPTLALQDTDSGTQQVGYLSYRNSANTESAWVGYGTAGDPDFSILNVRPSGDIVINPVFGNTVLNSLGTGSVGIGTAAPAAKLDVRGSVRLGPTGQFFAPKTIGDDSIIRGRVNNAGGIVGGSGFTATRTATGTYLISYSTAGFTSPPIIVATSELTASSAVVVGPTTLAVQIEVTSSSGAAVNSNFNFIIMGN